MRVHDFIGIGLGPFNLGLACLAAPLSTVDGVFLEQRDDFDWHPGLMLENATIQVPFLADLVTMADPTSEYSFLNYLKQSDRLYPFYIRQSFYPLRAEYNEYCRWATRRLSGLRFGQRVESVEHDGSYLVRSRDLGSGRVETRRARCLVLGIGSVPRLPRAAQDVGGPALHSADYLRRRDGLKRTRDITIVGSGQSAAEIYLDLLPDAGPESYHLTWVTRSPRFFPMEYTKLTLELTSPEYIAYFHSLPTARRDVLLREQRNLYKGISGELVDAIFDALYAKSLRGPVSSTLLTGAEVAEVAWRSGRYDLELRHHEQQCSFSLSTESLIFATGYRPATPAFLEPIRDRIRWDEKGRYATSLDYAIDVAGKEIFVQNAEEHTHGLTAPDLGMGPYRNSVILAAMLGREVYPVEKRIAFQHFGAPRSELVAS